MRSKSMRCGSTACIVAILAVTNAAAHHSFAPHFDSSKKLNSSRRRARRWSMPRPI